MKIILLSSSNVGSKTRHAMNELLFMFQEADPNHDIQLIDLAEKDMVFADGRNYLEYDPQSDMGRVLRAIMEADALIIGSPIFQSSIPASLKNIFDGLPQNALRDKIVGMVMTAGSPKHFLVAEYQLKPIITYMKGILLANYVFIEEIDFLNGEIVNDGVIIRFKNLIADTLLLLKTYQAQKEAEDQSFDF